MIIKLELTDNEMCQLYHIIENDIRFATKYNLDYIAKNDKRLLTKLNKIYMENLTIKEA